MLKKYVADLAKQSNVTVTHISLTAGEPVGVIDGHLLSLGSDGKMVSEFVL